MNRLGRRELLYYVQPRLANFRQELLSTLADNFDVVAFADEPDPYGGYACASDDRVQVVKTPIVSFFSGRLAFQLNVVSALLRNPPNILLIFANPRFLSFWVLAFVCKLRGIRFFAHGQGLYAYPQPGGLRRLIYKAMVFVSHKYICYTKLSQQSLLNIGCPDKKIVVAENSISFREVVPASKKNYSVNGILFIGRLRPQSNLGMLIKAIAIVRDQGLEIDLHIVGGGVEQSGLMSENINNNWISWHGAVFDEKIISEISKNCRVGFYPGNAGLSVVHLFALGLPPIVHSSISQHMGPEPSYITDGLNGFLFDREKGVTGIADVIRRVWQLDSVKLAQIGNCAVDSYTNLTSPTLGQRFVRIVSA